MAASDYRSCDVCGAKTFYDARLEYDFKEFPETGLYGVGDWAVICPKCAQVFEVRVVARDPRGPDA